MTSKKTSSETCVCQIYKPLLSGASFQQVHWYQLLTGLLESAGRINESTKHSCNKLSKRNKRSSLTLINALAFLACSWGKLVSGIKWFETFNFYLYSQKYKIVQLIPTGTKSDIGMRRKFTTSLLTYLHICRIFFSFYMALICFVLFCCKRFISFAFCLHTLVCLFICLQRFANFPLVPLWSCNMFCWKT